MTYICSACGDSYTEDIAVIDHTAGDPVDNEDGTHTVSCTVCTELITTEGHTYVAGECACGAVEEVACTHENATLDATAKNETSFTCTYTCPDCNETWTDDVAIGEDMTGYTGDIKRVISPTNDISMSFRFQNTGLSAYSDFLAYIEKEEYAATATTATIDKHYINEIDTATASGYYAYKFTDIAAYDMSSNITCYFYGYDAVNDCFVKITSTTYSVQQYVKDALATYASSNVDRIVKLRSALVDLLNYGAAVQTLRRTNTGNLANSTLTATEIAYGTSEYCNDNTEWNTLPDVVGAREGATDDHKITDVSRTLITAEKVKMQFTFTEYTGDINNYYAVVNYYDVRGGSATKTYSFAEAGFTNTKSGFLIGDPLMPTYDYPVSVVFYYGDPAVDGVAVFETVFSIEAYCENYYDFSNANVANVCKMIYAYGASMAAAVGTPAYVPPTAQ